MSQSNIPNLCPFSYPTLPLLILCSFWGVFVVFPVFLFFSVFLFSRWKLDSAQESQDGVYDIKRGHCVSLTTRAVAVLVILALVLALTLLLRLLLLLIMRMLRDLKLLTRLLNLTLLLMRLLILLVLHSMTAHGAARTGERTILKLLSSVFAAVVPSGIVAPVGIVAIRVVLSETALNTLENDEDGVTHCEGCKDFL
jgi:hypothetical protein